MKRKVLSLLLMIAMAITLLIGCGSENVDKGGDTDTNANQDVNMNESENVQDEEKNEIKSYIVSGDTVAYEDEYILLEISDIQRTSVSSSVSITVSNKTDKKLGIYPEKWMINGLCVKPDTFGYMEIGANEENVVNEVVLPIEKLEALGISNIGELVLQCDLRDASEDMLGDNIITSTLIGYQTSEYANMDTEMDISLNEIGECEGTKLYAAIVPAGFYSWSDISIVFVAENNGNETVNISMEDETNDVAIRSLTGAVAGGETFILGLWGTDNVNEGTTVKLYVTLMDESKDEVLVDGQEFEWIAK